MHESLFANPKALDVADLVERANTLGLSEIPFVQCLDGGDTAGQVQLDFEEGRRLGVSATPAFFIGIRQPDGSIALAKKVSGAVEFTVFEKEIQELLPEQRARR